MKKLIFNKANAKLIKLEKKTGKKVYSISTLSGIACPFAHKCLSWAEKTPKGLRIKDGKHTEFRCYSASQEAQYPTVYKSRKYNLDLMKNNWDDIKKLTSLITLSIPPKAEIIRINVAGDIQNQNVFDAWCEVAKLHPVKIFYAYTKSLNFWIKRLGQIPTNFKLTASKGGKLDNLIDKFKLRYTEVVYSKAEAKRKGLPLDEDDSHAALGDKSFSLLIHGQGPKKSLQSKIFTKRIQKMKTLAI